MSGAVIVALVLMAMALLAGVPSVFAFFIAALIIALAGGHDVSAMASYGFLEMGSIVLLTVPLLIFAGLIMERCGVDEMKLKRFVPAGIAMLLYAFAGGQSVAACFLASIVPGIILVLLHVAASKITARKVLQLQAPSEEEKEAVTDIEAADKAENIDKAEGGEDDEDENEEKKSIVPALITPILVLVGMCSGILTLMEAAAAAVIYILLVGWLFYRALDGEALKEALIETGLKAGDILLTLFSAMILSRLLIMEALPEIMTQGLVSISDNKAVPVLFVILLLIVAGVLTDKISAILLVTPVIVSVIIFIGINPVQFAVIAALSIGIGGVCLSRPMKPNLMNIALAWLPTLLLTACVPQISLFLPMLLGYV